MKKKILFRDTLIVAPVVIFAAVWLILGLGFDAGFAPEGADYATTGFLNLILPLFIIGVGQIVYAVVLIADIAKMQGLDNGKKVLYSIGVWFAVNLLYVLVYIARVIWLFSQKKKTEVV